MHPSQARSRVQEKEIAARSGGQVVIASGALDTKGDVRRRGVYRLEAKTTSHKSFSVTREMMRKVEDAALATDELPVIEIEFNDGKGNALGSVCVVPTYVLEMIAEYKNQ